jgi:hypothetical protein
MLMGGQLSAVLMLKSYHFDENFRFFQGKRLLTP